MVRLTELLAFIPTYQRALDFLVTSGIKDEFNSMFEYHQQTFEHMLRVGFLGGFISYNSQASEEDIMDITVAGLLHDIGKLKIPLEILDKHGRLTDAEFRVMQEHPRLGVEIVERYIDKSSILMAIRQHHEKSDGSGYYGDTDVSLFAERIRIVDIYDALTVDRCYRPKLPEVRAFEILKAEDVNPVGLLDLEHTRTLDRMWADLFGDIIDCKSLESPS